MDTFQVGDVVLLKSGDPRMTVESMNGESADCVWFEDNSLQRNTFNIATLKKPKVVTTQDILRQIPYV